MVNIEPQVSPQGRYGLTEAAKALGINPSTLQRYTERGLIKCSIRKSNGRRFWTGAELIRLWRACM